MVSERRVHQLRFSALRGDQPERERKRGEPDLGVARATG